MRQNESEIPPVAVQNASTLSEFLGLFEYWVELSSHRDEESWVRYLEPKLFAMGFGFYGIVGKIMRNEKSLVSADRRLSFKGSHEDTANNLARFLRVTMDRVESFESMITNPTAMELRHLSTSQRNQITSDLRLQLAGVMLEARSRMREGRGNFSLKLAHDEVADRIGNPFLKEFTKGYY